MRGGLPSVSYSFLSRGSPQLTPALTMPSVAEVHTTKKTLLSRVASKEFVGHTMLALASTFALFCCPIIVGRPSLLGLRTGAGLLPLRTTESRWSDASTATP